MALIFIHWAGSSSQLNSIIHQGFFFFFQRRGKKKRGFLTAVSDHCLYLCLTVAWTLLGQGGLHNEMPQGQNQTFLCQCGRTISTGPWEPSSNISSWMGLPFRWSERREIFLQHVIGQYTGKCFCSPYSTPRSEGQITISPV